MINKAIKLKAILALWGMLLIFSTNAQYRRDSQSQIGRLPEAERLDNKPESLEWLKDAGFGMFVHWGVDCQLGSVISHSLVGASDDYVEKYFDELPKTFNPKKYNPEDWIILAKLAGMKYVVFTTKHHSGFCMWDTKTTDFNIMNTPYGKDIVAPYVEACRKHGLKVGLYFSPEDFSFLHLNGDMISRSTPEANPINNKKFIAYDKAQIRELMTKYGKIDVLFFDGRGSGPLKELCWQINPDLLVTRGAINTPEQAVLGTVSDQPWEACVTMGTQWQYKANETYKSATRLIEILIETRAKGGSLLLNVGPKPDGELPIEQEERLREFALWNFLNHEAIEGVRPWILPNEGNIWYTRKDSAIYTYITGLGIWPRGDRKSFILGSVRANKNTKLEVLGQSGKHIEGRPLDFDIDAKWSQETDGLHISVVRAYRAHNDNRYYNPVVVKISNAEPALIPPLFSTQNVDALLDGKALLQGKLEDIGDAKSVEAGFQYRISPLYGDELYVDDWMNTKFIKITEAGVFNSEVTGLQKGKAYQYRTVVKHPLVKLYGDIKRFNSK